jgi:transposase
VQWRRIEALLPGRGGRVGRPAGDNRRFVHGVLWVLRSGMRWQDMPERYGKYKTTHKRFTRWAATGVWDRVFADLLKDRENRYVMIDSSVVRAHQQAATARKKGLRRPLWSGVEEV